MCAPYVRWLAAESLGASSGHVKRVSRGPGSLPFGRILTVSRDSQGNRGMKYMGVCGALATVGSLLALSACLEAEPAQVGLVSEAGGFVDPERRLASEGEESYCGAEVLR